MVGEDFGQRGLVFGLQQRVDRAGRQLAEGLVSGSEHREGAGTFERFDQTGGLHSGHQGSVIGGVQGVFNDVLGRIHFLAADARVVHSGPRVSDHQRDESDGGYQSSVHFQNPFKGGDLRISCSTKLENDQIGRLFLDFAAIRWEESYV